MEGRETQLENNVFYVCGLIEYIARLTHNTEDVVVDALGKDRLERMVEYADVLHSENIDAVSARLIEEADVKDGSDNSVSRALYGVPSHWDMGKVYKRLTLGIMQARGIGVVDALVEAFHSPIAPLLRDYNGSFFYEAPANVLTAHLTGVIE